MDKKKLLKKTAVAVGVTLVVAKGAQAAYWLIKDAPLKEKPDRG